MKNITFYGIFNIKYDAKNNNLKKKYKANYPVNYYLIRSDVHLPYNELNEPKRSI